MEYKDKKVSDVMTALDKVFMIESSTRLTFQVLMDIYKSGFTRIPVYEIDRQNNIGILFTKDLILIDPDDEVEIAAVISFHGNREGGFVRGVPDDTSLDKVFREFKSSYLHLLVAYGEVTHDGNPATQFDKDGLGFGNDRVANNHISDYTSSEYSLEGNRRVITGVITLEDVLEAVIKDEIVDETDNFIDVNKRETAVRGRGASSRSDPTNFLTLFEHKIRDQSKLSEAETAAITAFLSLNVPEFKKMARFGGVLKKLVPRRRLRISKTTRTPTVSTSELHRTTWMGTRMTSHPCGCASIASTTAPLRDGDRGTSAARSISARVSRSAMTSRASVSTPRASPAITSP